MATKVAIHFHESFMYVISTLSGGYGEEDFLMFFTIYGHGGHLEFGSKQF